jgi:hypothetical protein
MKQIILFSALAVSVLSTAFTSEKKPVLTSNQSKITALTNDFAFVRGHRQGKSITLTWGMVSNAGLVGFDIEKTNQDPNDPYSVWEDAGSVAGSDARSFKLNDSNVYPGQTHYRITAWYSDSRSSTSEILTVKIVSK